MSPDDREQLRLSLIRFLNRNQTRFGLSEPLLLQLAKAEGRSDLKDADVRVAIDYLEGKGLVHAVKKEVSPELRAWRITSAGVDFHAERE